MSPEKREALKHLTSCDAQNTLFLDCIGFDRKTRNIRYCQEENIRLKTDFDRHILPKIP